MTKAEILNLLRQNVVPALGCTEPVCVGLAAADAAKRLNCKPESLKVTVSRNIYKNGVSVGIAGFDRVGLDYAAALGACIADPEMGLELMSGITPEISKDAVDMVEHGNISLSVDKEVNGIFVSVQITGENETAETVISGGHTRIIKQTFNGKVIFEAGACTSASGSGSDLIEKLKCMTLAEIRHLTASASEAELEFLTEGVKMNEILAEFALEHNPGIGISGVFKKNLGGSLLGQGLVEEIMIRVAAATEARLEGCPYAAMSSAGSGSKGIAVILPVVMTAREIGVSKEQTLQAIAYAHLVNEYMNAHIGKLSALCACAMASASAASAAMTWLLGGDDEKIGLAVRNMAGTITGMICDGGKVGCALKLGTAVSAAVTCAILAAEGVGLRVSDGICAESAEDCVKNMARVGNPGMIQTDREILEIMIAK